MKTKGFQKAESFQQCSETKLLVQQRILGALSDLSSGHNILTIHCDLEQVLFASSKAGFDKQYNIYVSDFVYELPHNTLNNLRLY